MWPAWPRDALLPLQWQRQPLLTTCKMSSAWSFMQRHVKHGHPFGDGRAGAALVGRALTGRTTCHAATVALAPACVLERLASAIRAWAGKSAEAGQGPSFARCVAWRAGCVGGGRGGAVFVATQALGWALSSASLVLLAVTVARVAVGVAYCIRCWALATGTLMFAAQLARTAGLREGGRGGVACGGRMPLGGRAGLRGLSVGGTAAHEPAVSSSL